MASFASTYLPIGAKDTIWKTYGAILAGVLLVAAGLIILDDQNTISKIDNTKTNDSMKVYGWICIVLGGLIMVSPVVF